MKPAELKKAIAERGVTLNYLSKQVLSERYSVPYLSRVLNGKTEGLDGAQVQDLLQCLETWIDTEELSISAAYNLCYDLLKNLSSTSIRIVLRRLGGDL